jgi:hypothetical protein
MVSGAQPENCSLSWSTPSALAAAAVFHLGQILVRLDGADLVPRVVLVHDWPKASTSIAFVPTIGRWCSPGGTSVAGHPQGWILLVRGSGQQEEAAMEELTPAPVVEAILGYQQTAAMRAAIKLDLFSLACKGIDTAEDLAAACGADRRGVRILADFLTVHGSFAKVEGHYRPTAMTRAFLDAASPACMGSIVDFIASPEFMGQFQDDPTSYVRNGGSTGLANTAPENPIWVTFARAMIPFVALQSELVAQHVAAWPVKPRRILDIAAGHGMFGIKVAAAVPDADITALDWPNVLEVARENAERTGLGGRYHLRPGNAFDIDWGRGHDLVMLPNFLHHFDHAACVAILRRVRDSLAPSGRAFAVELVPNGDRVSPPRPATFAFMMLATTPRGDAYTGDEYRAMARDAGFGGVALTPLLPTPHTIVEFV